jgi:Glycosyl transferase family 2
MSPFEIRSNPLLGTYPLSLCAIVHDEMYFLPEFLAHYRGLGVARFIFLDDASTDGTADFLAAQPDCMILQSRQRYFDQIDGKRALYAWRQGMMDRFCRDQWAIFADADEFLTLPEGVPIADMTRRLDRRGSRAVWGLMLDIYPRDIAAIRSGAPFDLGDEWYFDARRHLWCRPGADRPITLYRGSRARLLAANHVLADDRPLRRIAARLGLGAMLKLNNLGKVPLVKWSAETRFDGSHRVTPPPLTGDLLAILHFKFTADLGRKIAYALATGGYEGGSRQYRLMGALLAAMEVGGRDFLSPESRRLHKPGDPYLAGVAHWQASDGTRRT